MPRPIRIELIAAWLFLLLILGGPLAVIMADHFDRASVLDTGLRADAAIVDERVGKTKTGGAVCTTVLAFRADGREYRIEQRDCEPGKAIGKRVPIAYDPANPQDGFAVADGTWIGGNVALPALLAAGLVAGTVLLLIFAFRGHAASEARI